MLEAARGRAKPPRDPLEPLVLWGGAGQVGAELGFSTEHGLAAMVSIPGTRLGTAPEAEQRLGNVPGFGEQDGTTGRGDVTGTRILSTTR